MSFFKFLLTVCLATTGSGTPAQNIRYKDANNINWLQTFATVTIGKKTSLISDIQLRRVDGLKNNQQLLIRTGLQYRCNDALSVAGGYAFAKTYVYGDFPIAANGAFTEHRLFEQVSLKQQLTKVSINHRFRIEQRWLELKSSAAGVATTGWRYANRFRYFLKVQYPLSKFYCWAGNELFISAGKNIGVNIFDQNRIHINAGYKINKHTSAEIGYINQTLQQGKILNNNIIMQHNNGITLAVWLNL